MNRFRITKIVTKIKFEELWGELERKNSFQRQSLPKYLRLTLALM